MAVKLATVALLLMAGSANALNMHLRANHSHNLAKSFSVGTKVGSAVVQYSGKHGIMWSWESLAKKVRSVRDVWKVAPARGLDLEEKVVELQQKLKPTTAPDLEIFFVTDCTPYTRWQAYNVFSSAGHAGQEDPITWVRAGCDPANVEKGAHDLDIAAKIYPKAKLFDVVGFWGKDFNLGGGVPKAVQSFLEANPTLSNTTQLVLLEGDMVFLQKLEFDDESLEKKGMPIYSTMHRSESGSLVGGNVGMAAHYDCCNDIGPPYLLSVAGWRDVAPVWNALMVSGGWGGDQVAIGKASIEAGIKWNVYDHLMVSNFHAQPGWKIVEDAISVPEGDACATKKFGLHEELIAKGKNLPTFMHVVNPWSLATWGFSKYQVPPGWKNPTKTDGILECAMPMFAEPPSDLLTDAQVLMNGQPAAPSTLKAAGDKRSGWAVCTILHSLNTMLASYKKAACASETINEVKGLQMQVPLAWTNVLLEGALDKVPAGVDRSWVESCATRPHC